METGFKSLGQREMAGRGMVTLFASMDWAAHFSWPREPYKDSSGNAQAQLGPVRGLCRAGYSPQVQTFIRDLGWGRESVCLGMTGTGRAFGDEAGDSLMCDFLTLGWFEISPGPRYRIDRRM